MIDSWPVPTVAAAVVGDNGSVTTHGNGDHSFRLASITKIISTWAIMIAVEEGVIALHSAVGQPGCTLRHLLSHAGGYGFDSPTPVSAPGRRRIYSNTGIELAADAVAHAAGIPFGEYLREAVLDPLDMTHSALRGSPAHGIWSTIDDCVKLVRELMHPRLLAPETVHEATTTQFGELAGVVPGLGSYRPCPWGLGVEIRGGKHPHWTGTRNSPATFGHFGGAGTMLWVDPAARIGVVALTDRAFTDWRSEALELWPQFSDAVLSASAALSDVALSDAALSDIG
ncbi:MAG: serine hydrolase [Actinobacteria bacterium]|nr:serine hydrolase [Actinomycetota bacterium]